MSARRTPRNEWPRITVPQEIYDLLLILALSHGYNQRTMYLFLYQMAKQAYAEEVSRLAASLETEDFDISPPKKRGRGRPPTR